MSAAPRQLAGLILASALITFDGTATIVALPAIGHDLSATMARLQWVVNAPLLVLAALLLPAGTLADRYGRGRLIRIGLTVFGGASIACTLSHSDDLFIACRFAQGIGGALLLPACLAVLRAACTDAEERARVFGIWAAWTGAASAVGPLMAGALVDIVSWRALFLVTTVGAGIALRLLRQDLPLGAPARHVPLPGVGTVGLVLFLGAVAYALMQTAEAGLAPARLAWPVGLAIVSGLLLVRERHRYALLPRELLASRNCVPANAATFAFYFGMFGVSFLAVLYVQQVLRYSAMWGAVVMLPTSLMLLLAERFGRLTPVVGTRALIVTGALLAAAGIGWMGARSHPLPFWSHIIVGTSLFGLGLSVAASALTHAAVAAVPETYAGAASGLNHAVVRAAGLVAVALLGSIAAPGVSEMVSAEGVQRAMILCALVVGIGGVWGSTRLRDEAPGGLGKD
ncbi:MAG: MFS transporter [Vicinamibacterales bacterium]